VVSYFFAKKRLKYACVFLFRMCVLERGVYIPITVEWGVRSGLRRGKVKAKSVLDDSDHCLGIRGDGGMVKPVVQSRSSKPGPGRNPPKEGRGKPPPPGGPDAPTHPPPPWGSPTLKRSVGTNDSHREIQINAAWAGLEHLGLREPAPQQHLNPRCIPREGFR